MPLTRPRRTRLRRDVGLAVAAEEHAVGQDDGALAAAGLERLDKVQEEGVVAVPGGRDAVLEAPELVVGGVEAVGPRLGREGRVGDGEVEGLEAAVRALEVGRGERVAAVQLRRRVLVQNHVHARQRPGGVVHLLAVHGDAVRRLIGGLEQQRARAARRVVDGLVLPRAGTDADHLRDDAGHLGGRVELPLALARLGGEVPHQVLVGVAEQVVAPRPVGAEVEPLEDGDQLPTAGPASPGPSRACCRRRSRPGR